MSFDDLFPPEGIENTLSLLQAFNPGISSAKIRIHDTRANRFVDRALAKQKKP